MNVGAGTMTEALWDTVWVDADGLSLAEETVAHVEEGWRHLLAYRRAQS